MKYRFRSGPRRRWWCLLLLAFFAALPAAAQPEDSAELDAYNEGVGFYNAGRYQTAVQALSKFLKDSPQHPRAENARFLLGRSRVQLEDWKGARGTFEKYLQEHPKSKKSAEARYWVGHCSFHSGDYTTAARQLADFIRDNPEHPLAAYALPYLGEAQLQLKEPANALESFRQSLDKQPQGAMVAEARFGVGKALEALGKSAEAEDVYRQIAADREQEFASDARFRLASSLFDRGEFRGAADEFSGYQAQFPEGPQFGSACLFQGYALYEAGDFQAALVPLTKAAGIEAVAADAALWTGYCQKKLRQFQQAAQTLSQAFEKHRSQPQGEQLLFHWADSLLKAGEPGSALTRFQQLLTEFPKGRLREESYDFATLSAIQGQSLAVADRLGEQYRAEFPQGRLRVRQEILAGRVKLLRGTAAERDGQSAAAQRMFRQAADVFAQAAQATQIASTRQQAQYFLAEANLRLGDYQQVLESTESLVAAGEQAISGPEFADVLLKRGVAHLELARQSSKANAASAPPPEVQRAIVRHCRAARGDAARYLALVPRGGLGAQAWYITAVTAALEGNREELIAPLETLRRAHPQSTERELALQEVGDIAYSRDDFSGAEALYAELTEITSDPGRQPQAWADLGWSRAQQKKHAEAIEAFQHLLNNHPDHPLAAEGAFMIGQSLAAQGKKQEAQRAYAAAFSRPGESEHTFQAGWLGARMLFELGERSAADTAYEAVLQRFARHPRIDRVLDDWAMRYYDAEEFDRSDELFGRLAAEFPKSPLSWNARAIVAESDLVAGRTAQARTQFVAIVESKSADPQAVQQALRQLQNIARETQQWRELREWSDRALRDFPDGLYAVEAEYSRGEADLMLNDLPEAVARLKRLAARKTEPELAARPWFGKVLVRLAEAMLRQKEYDQVRELSAELQEWNPESQWQYQMWEIEGRALKNEARFADARKKFQQTITDPHGRKTETAARAEMLLADTHVLEKNYEAAVDEYLKVEIGYQFKYWQAAALFQAGNCQESLKDPAAARRTYTRVLTQYPESEVARKAKERLQALRVPGGS